MTSFWRENTSSAILSQPYQVICSSCILTFHVLYCVSDSKASDTMKTSSAGYSYKLLQFNIWESHHGIILHLDIALKHNFPLTLLWLNVKDFFCWFWIYLNKIYLYLKHCIYKPTLIKLWSWTNLTFLKFSFTTLMVANKMIYLLRFKVWDLISKHLAQFLIQKQMLGIVIIGYVGYSPLLRNSRSSSNKRICKMEKKTEVFISIYLHVFVMLNANWCSCWC